LASCRFYGRIAKETNCYDQETLDAIKANVSGLSRISGERIWSELKKILEGNYAGDLMQTMLKVGVAEFIGNFLIALYCFQSFNIITKGLPKELDVKRFAQTWSNLEGKKYNAITLIAGLISSEQEVCSIQIKF
jgi:tRNA nucleotidyltransferase/poly(A) polymerase